ncbi:MAG TPA: tetratricopeptide repeat protein [Trebonia sp.]|nr:tetratricopeptide repeat protein [Trebonia sp.]
MPDIPSPIRDSRPGVSGPAVPPQSDIVLPPVPPLAVGFVPRPETGQAAEAALVPGTTVVLVPDRGAGARLWTAATTERVAAGAREWPDSCGKTQLAIWQATALRDSGAVEIVVWVSATSRASVLSGYAEAAMALGLQASGDAEAVAASLIGWLRDTSRPWLFVLDDVREASALDRLWPTGPAGRVLVTATSPAAARPGGRQDPVIIPVGPMSRRESLSYLMSRLTEDLDQRQGAADLVAELGDEPLALLQASSVIATSELTCRGYLDQFVARREAAGVAVASPAALTWAMAVEHCEVLAPAIAHLQLTFASLLDGNGMPYSAFITAGRQREVLDATLVQGLAALEAAGLVSIDRTLDPPLVRMNWAVQAAARAASSGAMIGPVANAAANALLADWPADGQPPWLARAFRSCADSLRRGTGDALWRDGCHQLLLRAGESLDALPAPSAAVDYWSDLAATSDRLLGSDHPDTLAISGRLASAYLAAGRASEAIAWYQWVRGDRASRLGHDVLETADASRDLGTAQLAAGRAPEAAETLTEAVSTYDHVAGTDSPRALDTRDELITALRASGKLSEAIWLGKRVLADRERVQGARHPDALATAARLAEAYLANGDTKAAIAQLRTVVAERESALGTRHVLTIAARGTLASAYYGAGKMASAVHLYEQVWTEYCQVIGGDSRSALSASLNLAHALYGLGRLTDAARLMRETVERCKLQLPDDDPIAMTAAETLRNISGESPQPASPAPAVPAGQEAGPEQRVSLGRRVTGRHRTGR